MFAKNIKLLSIFNFLVEFGLYGPIAILYFAQVSGSYALAASVFSIIMLSSSILELPTGVWSDRVGRRRTIIAGSWARVFSIVLYATGLSYWYLVIGAILEGLARSLYSGNNDALLYDTLADAGKHGEYSKYLGKLRSYEHLAVAIASLIGGIVATFSFAWLMWLSLIPHLVKLAISYQFIEPKHRKMIDTNIYAHTMDAIKLFVKNRKLRMLSIADTISYSTGEVSFQLRATFFASIWPIWAIGVLNTITQIGAATSFYFSDKLIKKMGHEKLLVVRSIIGKLSGLIAFGIPSILSPLITFFPSFLYGAGQVAKSTLMQREFTDYQRATMSSLNSLASSLGFAVISVLVGLFADKTSPATALFTLTLIAVPIISLYWNIFQNGQQA